MIEIDELRIEFAVIAVVSTKFSIAYGLSHVMNEVRPYKIVARYIYLYQWQLLSARCLFGATGSACATYLLLARAARV